LVRRWLPVRRLRAIRVHLELLPHQLLLVLHQPLVASVVLSHRLSTATTTSLRRLTVHCSFYGRVVGFGFGGCELRARLHLLQNQLWAAPQIPRLCCAPVIAEHSPLKQHTQAGVQQPYVLPL